MLFAIQFQLIIDIILLFQTFSRYSTRSTTDLLFTLLRQMIQEELLMRRNRYRSREQRESDELIEKIEIKEPEFAKRVSVFLFYRFLSYYSQCITFNRLIFDYFFPIVGK